MTQFSSTVAHFTRKRSAFVALAALTFALLAVGRPALAEPKLSPAAEISSISVPFVATADQMAAALNKVVGRDLGVRAVLSGRLLQRDNRVIVRTELIDVSDGAQLWGQEYNRASADVFVLQEQLAREISERTVGGLNVAIAYDASAPDTGVSWPFVWYLRDFTALRSFDQPTRSLRDAVAVIVDQKNFDKIEAALGNNFYKFDYIRMWWPNQDYFAIKWDSIDAERRAAAAGADVGGTGGLPRASARVARAAAEREHLHVP